MQIYNDNPNNGLYVQPPMPPAKQKPSNISLYVVLAVALLIAIPITFRVLFPKKLPEATGRQREEVLLDISNMNKGYVVKEDYEFNENVAKGLVSRLSPGTGSVVEKGGQVTVYISRGTPIVLSDLVNSNAETAKTVLSGQKLSFTCTEEYSEDISAGNIISMDPVAGTTVEEGTNINLVVSLGSEFRIVPDYNEVAYEDFVASVRDLGLNMKVVEDFSDEIPLGDIIECSPAPGEQASVQEAFILYVSKGPGIIVPDVTGTKLDKAQSTLEKLGLTVTTSEEYSDEAVETVLRQSVSADDRVDEGSSITLTISKGTVEQEFKNACEKVSYDDLMRYPGTYENSQIRVRVKVTEIENETFLGLKYGETVWATMEGQTIVLTEGRENPEPALRAGDTVTIYGYGNGTSTVNVKQQAYQGGLAFGFTYNKTVDSYDVPNVKIQYIEF